MRIVPSFILILNWDTPFVSPVIQMAQTQTSSTATALSSKLTDFFGAYLEKLCYQVLDSQASLNILPLFSNPMNLTASTDVNMAFQGYVEDKTKSFLSSELWFPWLVYTLTPGEFSTASRNLQLFFELILAIGQLVISRHLPFQCGCIIEEQSASKAEKKFDHGNVLSKKEGKCLSIPAKPTGIEKEKDIAGWSEH